MKEIDAEVIDVDIYYTSEALQDLLTYQAKSFYFDQHDTRGELIRSLVTDLRKEIRDGELLLQ